MSFSHKELEHLSFGLKLFNEEKYWECHEELEHWWLDESYSPHRYIYWLVIQVAACLIHVRDKKKAGAYGMIRKSKKKLSYIESQFIETKVLFENIENWTDFKEAIRLIDSSAEIEDQDKKLAQFRELAKFKFEGKWKQL